MFSKIHFIWDGDGGYWTILLLLSFVGLKQDFWSKTFKITFTDPNNFSTQLFGNQKVWPRIFFLDEKISARLTRRVNPNYIVFLRKNAWLLIPSHIVHGFGCWERLNSFFVFSGYLCGSFPPSPPLFLSRIPFKPPPPLCFGGCSW